MIPRPDRLDENWLTQQRSSAHANPRTTIQDEILRFTQDESKKNAEHRRRDTPPLRRSTQNLSKNSRRYATLRVRPPIHRQIRPSNVRRPGPGHERHQCRHFIDVPIPLQRRIRHLRRRPVPRRRI
jgi:hypothetical protein